MSRRPKSWPRAAAAAWALALLASATLADPPTVRVGLERLEGGAAALLGGQRLGLVVHAASRTEDGRHAIDVLRAQQLDLVLLFSPEHGLRGRAAAGEAVTGGRDPVSALEVVSLYGEKRAPSAEDLERIDTLVFDLQGAGVRFYTYVSTLILCLDAAAEAGVPLVVLDRPNPLGGHHLAGPASAPREQVPASFVNLAPGPLVHGLTLGEMARLVNLRRASSGRPAARLTVVPMTGWRRSMTWHDTGRRWLPPSPNLRTPDAALAYPGTAFFEATNVSEGRGTDAPFLVVGAPWLDGETWRTKIDDADHRGFTLTPTRFTPVGSAAAPHPKHEGVPCGGLRIAVTDPLAADGYRLGVALLEAAMGHDAFAWRRDGAALTWLVGSEALGRALRDGHTVESIVTADAADHERWRRERSSALLYGTLR